MARTDLVANESDRPAVQRLLDVSSAQHAGSGGGPQATGGSPVATAPVATSYSVRKRQLHTSVFIFVFRG